MSRCEDIVLNKGGKLLTNKHLLSSTELFRLIGPGGRTKIIVVATRAQGFSTKSQIGRNNGTDEQNSGATRMACAHMIQALQHPELDKLGLVAIRDFLKKQARYLRLVSQKNKGGRSERQADNSGDFD
jgi:hypothetical protein